MKVSSREAAGFLRNPPDDLAAILLYGPDAMRISLLREDFLKRRLGENAGEEMRLTRFTGADLRSEPAALQDATRAMGFFPGPRAVLVTDATDGLAKLLNDALEDADPDDALIFVEAGNLGKGSALRKSLEASPKAAAIGIYPEPAGRGDVEEALKTAGVAADRDAVDAMVALAQQTDPGDFRQLTEKLALYSMGGSADLAAVQAISPGSTEAAVDDVVGATADGASDRIGPLLARLAAQGVTPITLVIAASRHFRALHLAASDGRGADQGIARLRPPVFGPRRERMARQARTWGMHRLETALSVLLDTDRALRSSTRAPGSAVLERALIRVAMMCPRR